MRNPATTCDSIPEFDSPVDWNGSPYEYDTFFTMDEDSSPPAPAAIPASPHPQTIPRQPKPAEPLYIVFFQATLCVIDAHGEPAVVHNDVLDMRVVREGPIAYLASSRALGGRN